MDSNENIKENFIALYSYYKNEPQSMWKCRRVFWFLQSFIAF